ncbi:unnamed protein product [Prunus armeniaca]
MCGAPKKPQRATRARSLAFRVGTAQYNLVPPAVSGLSRTWSCVGRLRSEDLEGATPARLEVAAGPVAHRPKA